MYLLTYSMVQSPLEKLTGLQLVKKFPAFHETQRFITTLTSVRHLSLSWASPIQSIYPHPTFWRSIPILSTHLRLGLPSGSFPPVSPARPYTWAVQKVSDLWPAKIQLFILTSETLIPFKVVSLVMHTLLPAVLPLLETFLESFLWNLVHLVQLVRRVLHNVFS